MANGYYGIETFTRRIFKTPSHFQQLQECVALSKATGNSDGQKLQKIPVLVELGKKKQFPIRQLKYIMITMATYLYFQKQTEIYFRNVLFVHRLAHPLSSSTSLVVYFIVGECEASKTLYISAKLRIVDICVYLLCLGVRMSFVL